MIVRAIYYSIGILVAIYIIAMSLESGRLNQRANAQLDISHSTELAWKELLETLSLNLYSGASIEREKIATLFAESRSREKRAVWASVVFAAITLVFFGYLYIRNGRSAENLLADLCAVGLLTLIVGLLAPVLTLKAFASLPVLGQVVLKYEAKSIFATVGTLVKNANYAIAVAVALFSIVLPLAKFLAMFSIMQSRWPQWREQSVRFVKAVGKWSMADVFVVAILIAYFAFNADEFSEANAGVGIYFFIAYCLFSQVASHLQLGAKPQGES